MIQSPSELFLFRDGKLRGLSTVLKMKTHQYKTLMFSFFYTGNWYDRYFQFRNIDGYMYYVKKKS